jgi:hypothetical protein
VSWSAVPILAILHGTNDAHTRYGWGKLSVDNTGKDVLYSCLSVIPRTTLALPHALAEPSKPVQDLTERLPPLISSTLPAASYDDDDVLPTRRLRCVTTKGFQSSLSLYRASWLVWPTTTSCGRGLVRGRRIQREG